jgi:hypothetical protein
MNVQVCTGSESQTEGGVLHIKRDSSKVINWANSSDRKWLTNHQHWAIMNGKSVTIRPAPLLENLDCIESR